MDPGAIIGIIETCYKTGAKVIEVCNTWRNAENEVKERITIFEICWARSRLQVEFIARIAHTIDYELRRIWDDLLAQLALKLSIAVKKIQEVLYRESQARPGIWGFGSRVKRTAYVMKKEALDDVIKELEAWQRRSDPSWFMLMKIPDALIDKELANAKSSNSTAATPGRSRSPLALAGGLRHAISPAPRQRPIFLPSDSLELVEIPYSSARAGRRTTGDTNWFVIDTIESRPGVDPYVLDNDVRKLATKLTKADPFAFGLLKCRGVVRVMEPSPSRDVQAFNLILQVPEDMETLQSLRHLLLGPDEDISLTRKFRIAREIARSVVSVHTFNFVHKNVRPESVLCFEDPATAKSHTFLVGFDAFRSADGGTLLLGDMAWERNIYRHPLRQGEFPTEAYRMEHDIYSLGVCLLEIGLWESFVNYTTQQGNPTSTVGNAYERFQAWLQAKNAEPGQLRSRNTGFLEALAFRLKEYLVELAREKLPRRMGDKYTEVVVSCLTCLDDETDDVNGPSDRADGDGILVACRFIESIMLDLEDIST